MEKTVLVIVGNQYSSHSCGQSMKLELSQGGKGNKAANTRILTKSVWTCCVEAVSEYCRVVLDLFPEQHQVCVAAVDETKCQPINSWRDEDQDISKVQTGFQTFGFPVFSAAGSNQGGGGRGNSSHLTSCMQGLQYAVRCLAQLTATQYATTTSQHTKKPLNQGRIIFVCCLRNDGDVKELEKAVVNLVRSENADIKQKQDPARLSIHQCQLVIVHTYASSNSVKDAPLTQLSSVVSSVTYSFPATILLEKAIHLAKMHFDLKSTIITGIPMKEEQAGGSSANYDVELIHLSEAHRDILRAGYSLGSQPIARREGQQQHKDHVSLRWSTPKATSMELHFCTSTYRVTPSNVTSRPTICLINFVLSGKSVSLEQSRKGPSKVISHILANHSGAIFLHCIPTCRQYLDDPPSISEGWGGRITDYRISDFNDLVLENLLYPLPVTRTKIPSIFPIQKAMAKLEHDTRYWPMVYNDSILYTLRLELEPLPTLIKRPVISESELESCRRVVLDLQARESSNESLAVPSTGGRNKGVRREEQYRTLWCELETLAKAYNSSSDKHRLLHEFIVKTMTSCGSCSQLPRKLPTPPKTEGGVTSSSNVFPAGGTYKPEAAAAMAWQEVDKFQQMTEREKSDYFHGNTNNAHGNWKTLASSSSSPGNMVGNAEPLPLPTPSKSTGSLLSLWTSRQQEKARTSHTEFAGRSYGDVKVELYSQLRSGSAEQMNQDLV